MSQYRQSPFANIPPVVKNLLIINVICYAAEWVLGSHLDIVKTFSAFYFDSPFFRPWQVVTYLFMHDPSSLWHLIGNMFALFIFGPTLEYTMGSKRFFNYYFICGIGALLMQTAVQAIEVHNIAGTFRALHFNGVTDQAGLEKLQEIYFGPILGASGAIFGLLLAFGMLFPNVEMFIIPIPFPIKAKYLVTGYILVELFLGYQQFAGDSVAHFAHIGGALVGFILIKIWGLRGPQQFY
jgi:membrane associated rhomboid family serine protease